MRPSPLFILVVAATLQLGLTCKNAGIAIVLPGGPVATPSFDITVELEPGFDAGSFSVILNGANVTARFTGGPETYTATILPGAPLRDANWLVARVRRNGELEIKSALFDYLPPGKASAVQIDSEAQLITGPLGHSKFGDWLLANGRARFVIQDVAQRELYSVGQYGGNIIDAELVGNEGKDNFLEVQPGVNIETVINAQTLEIVNDGQDGTAAILRTCGPDDLLDFVNPSSQVTDLNLPFPALADDRDLDIEGCTTYSLAPDFDPADPQDFVRIDTEIFNNEPVGGPTDPAPLLIGDWLNPAGEVETLAHSVAPPSGLTPRANGIGPPVTTNIGALSFFGYDEASGTDYSFVEPAKASPATFAFISGVLVVLHQDNLLQTLIGGAPSFLVPAGDSATFTRYFGVGDGSAANAYNLEQRVNGSPVATLSGCVSVGGVPVAGAKVTGGLGIKSTTAATSVTAANIFAHFVTKAGPCPNYSGTVQPGLIAVTAAKRGHLYPGGTTDPAVQVFGIAPGDFGTADFDLAPAGRLEVSSVDAAGQPLPARVTVVGFDPSPPQIRAGPALPGFGGSDLGLFDDASDRLPFGLTAVGYTDATGQVAFDLEPGVERYHVFVSRGTEYSAWRTATPITIAGGATTTLAAQIARVVDTPGFISSDFHVHGIRSADSRVSDLHRVEAFSSEGVENVIMTDHHVHTDLEPAIGDAGLSDFMTATIGEEITSFDYGHFNAYPLQIDPASPTATYSADGLTQLSGGSTDWARPAPPGMDFPAYGAFNGTPAEIFALATTGPHSTNSTAVQINHIDSHFEPLKIDTSLVPPADQLTDAQRAARRLPSTGAVPNLYHHFPALEIWNGDNRGDQAQFLNDRIGIWFNLLNQGLPTTFIADTDTHTFFNLKSAGARTWTASPTDDPAAIDPADVASAVYDGRAVGGQGIYVQTRLVSFPEPPVRGAEDGPAVPNVAVVADLTHGGSTSVTAFGGEVSLQIDVQSPSWAQWDRVEIYSNATTHPTGNGYTFGATPDLVLDEGDCDPSTTGDGDFDITVTQDVGGVAGADRLSATLEVPISGIAEPTWFVVVVRGSDGECSPMFPIYPANLENGSNTNLADLVDGNVGEAGVMALGATNALYAAPAVEEAL